MARLGNGGFGTVYKARTRHLGNTVALKVLFEKHHCDDPQMIARFWAEGKILGALGGAKRHHIVSVHDMGRSQDGDFFIEMDFVEGQTLSERLREHGAFKPMEALRLLRQLASALRHAHAHRFIHRDIKPANLIVDEDGRLTLIDFGIAKQLDADSLTSASMMVGTKEYAAPEQFDADAFGKISACTDVYSLGILGYQLLTNRLPFLGSLPELMRSHLEKPLPPFPANLDIPAEVAAFIAQCTQKRQADRFQNMQEVEAAIDAIFQQEAIAEYQELCMSFADFRNITPKQRQILENNRKRLELSQEITIRIEQDIPRHYKAGDEWTDPITGMEFVWIPPGRFMMGQTEAEKRWLFNALWAHALKTGHTYYDKPYTDELPCHEVQIKQGFWLGKCPVTQAQWLAVMGQNPSNFNEKKVGKDWRNHPVERVSWDDAQAFIEKLNATQCLGCV